MRLGRLLARPRVPPAGAGSADRDVPAGKRGREVRVRAEVEVRAGDRLVSKVPDDRILRLASISAVVLGRHAEVLAGERPGGDSASDHHPLPTYLQAGDGAFLGGS